MLPEEAQALMAKVLLVVFGTIIICLSKVRASDLPVSCKNIQKVRIQSIDCDL